MTRGAVPLSFGSGASLGRIFEARRRRGTLVGGSSAPGASVGAAGGGVGAPSIATASTALATAQRLAISRVWGRQTRAVNARVAV